MANLAEKARNYFIAGSIAERLRNFDVASTNYFKSLSAVNDHALAGMSMFPGDHNERFEMLKEKIPFLYRITSSLFLTYRRTYTKEITQSETAILRRKVKEAFAYAKIHVPADTEVKDCIKRALEG
jgi:hypothetical protein